MTISWIQSGILLLDLINAQAAGRWDASGSSGVVCIHTMLIPNMKIVCNERPRKLPYTQNPNTNQMSTSVEIE